MNRGDAETPREDVITSEIIGAAIEVHRDGLKRVVNNYQPSSAPPRLGG